MFAYILRHWRGQLSLPVTFWVGGLLVAVVNIGCDYAFAYTWAEPWVMVPLTGIMSIWYLVGVFKSAWARGGFLGFLTGVVVIAWPIAVVVSLYNMDPMRYPAEMRMTNDHQIFIYGKFGEGTADRLTQMLQKHPDVIFVALESPGGLFFEGVKVGEIIHKNNLATFVYRSCDSACTLAFMAGTRRIFNTDGASLGFHAVSSSGDVQILWGWVMLMMSVDDISQDFIRKAFSTPDIWRPTLTELQAAKVITEIWSG